MSKKNNFENSSRIYFTEISNCTPLTLSEEIELWKKYKNNNDIIARDKLISSNLKFVANVASKYQGRGLSYSELISEGNYGLLKAIDRFDFKLGYKTISYSVWWIKQSIMEALNKRNGLKYDDLPSDFEKQIECDDIDYESKDETPQIKDNSNYSINDDLTDNINFLLESLSEREKIIISYYYGLYDEPLTLEEIGEKLNLTKERVRQIKERALKKLRTNALDKSITI